MSDAARPTKESRKAARLEAVEKGHPTYERELAPGVVIRESDHAKEWGDQPTIRFFPDHFISEATAMVLLMCLYTALAIFLPAGLDIKSNPAVTPEGSKPEWYFLFLYAFLHFVPPLVGTFTPVVGLAVLLLWPWIDRNPERAPAKRKIAIAGALITVAVILALTILGMLE